MIRDMKFEDSLLTGYLVKNLEPLTEADPVILAEYVVALLKKDKPTKELQKLCADNLVEFLGDGTKSFIAKLFKALEDGSIAASAESLDSVQQVEQSASFAQEDPAELKISSPKPGLSPDYSSDPEEKEVSDDDDDDRNHKHRRRETPSQSFDRDIQEFRSNRKRNRPFENGQPFIEYGYHLGETRKEYNFPPAERDLYSKSEKRRPGFASISRAPLDLNQNTRVHQAFQGDSGPHFDMSTSLSQVPIGRGRARSSGLWSQNDLRFNSAGTLDFSSQMAPQGSTPSLFAGRGLPNVATPQNASWGLYGLIPGVPNGVLDTLHPLGLQGTLRPPINPSLNMSIPRQRCRDFEERGFCLRGDMCPMEHGVNRIVVEDVQSLSQFNLPVSLPNSRLRGMPTGTGPLPSASAPSSMIINKKISHGRNNKPGATDDELGLNGMPSASAGAGEADFYDPDQPLWSNDCSETSTALLRLNSPKINEVEPFCDPNPSDHNNLRLPVGVDHEHPGRSLVTAGDSQSTKSSIWRRIGNSRNKLELAGKIDSTVTSTGHLENESKGDQDEALLGVQGIAEGKPIITEDVGRDAKSSATLRIRSDPVRNVGRPPQKASRTLFVNGIPLENNKKESLLSHFQKFGEVVDIYIPRNSERAFVQFSKREEAEAALKSPDAVMGNRFIKLWWANRDSIPDAGTSSGNSQSAIPGSVAAASVPSQPSDSNRGKEKLPTEDARLSILSASEVPLAAGDHPKPIVANGPKVTPPSQKKLESLELLKEELRKKQEMLDQKRNDFRRQLDKLEKQTSIGRNEVTSEKSFKRHKVGTLPDVSKATTSPTNAGAAGMQSGAEKTSDKDNTLENILPSSSKTNSAMVLQSSGSLKQPVHSPASVGAPFLVNRFKLDNRPLAFRILPPLPSGFADVAVMKEHFSSYSDLSAVELEDSEAHNSTVGSVTSNNCSACITFTMRRSAERAFLNGKCWKGNNLQFVWLTTSSSNNHSGGRENAVNPAPKCPPDAEVQIGMASVSSLSIAKLASNVSQGATSSGNGEPDHSKDMNGDTQNAELVGTSQSSPATVPLCEVPSLKDDAC